MMMEEDGVCEFDFKNVTVDILDNPGAIVSDDMKGSLVKYVTRFDKERFMKKFMNLWE